jgi:hypothetical protein
MKFPHHCNDHPVQVWREERQVLAEYAHFYEGIFMTTFRFFGSIMFVPPFGRTADKWPPTLPADVDRPESAEQARIYSATFRKYTITPDEELAGQSESFYLSFTHKVDPETSIFLNGGNVERTGRLFYVTSEQYALFSQELLEIEQHTLWANKYIGLSKVKHFECMKFIMANIAPREERLWGERRAKSIFGMSQPNKPVATNQAELVAA